MADLRGILRRGIAVAVILLAFCALCAPAHAGVSPDVGRYIGDLDNGTYAYIGETNLKFVDTSGAIITEGYLVSAWENSNINIFFPNSGSAFDSEKEAYRLLPGFYKVTDLVGVEKTRVYFASNDELRVITEVRGEKFSWVTKGGDITFKAETKLHNINDTLPNNISYKLLDSDGIRVPSYKVGVSLTNIDVSGNGENSTVINTANLNVGTYTLSIETDPETNNGLDIEGIEVTFEIRSKGITIEAVSKEQYIGEDIVFTISTTPNTNITLQVTAGKDSNVRFEEGAMVGGVVTGGRNASGVSDEQGNFKASASFNVTGGYQITATELFTNTTDDEWVKILRKGVTIDEPEENVYYIGEIITIKGTAPSKGEKVTIKIDGAFLVNITKDFFVDYGFEWDTNGYTPGMHKIEIWVQPQSDPDRDPPDASVSIVLIRGGLIIELSAPFVALGDDFEIEKIIAPGRDRVDILTSSPDGGSGRGFDSIDILVETGGELNAPGLTYDSYSKNPEDVEFTEDDMDKFRVAQDVDLGTYLIVALNYGRDGIWGRSQSDDLLAVISNNYATSLGVKTTDQLLAIVKDKTINAAGSDDLLGIATISVEQGFVTVDELEDVPLGGDIKVTGTTNRQVDTAIIVTVESLDVNGAKLKPKIAMVKEDEKTYYNTFDVTFDTESANIGTYQVTVDDGDGHTASTTVSILPAEEHSVNVSTTPSPKPAETEPVPTEPTSTPSPTMTPVLSSPSPTPESAKEPGFEVLPALIALAVLCIPLVRSRQKR